MGVGRGGGAAHSGKESERGTEVEEAGVGTDEGVVEER
jgi:hypothetical protein